MEHSSLHHLLILPNTKELRKCVVCADGGPSAEEILPFSHAASCQQAIRFWSCLISLQRHRLYNNLLGAFGQVRQLHEKKKVCRAAQPRHPRNTRDKMKQFCRRNRSEWSKSSHRKHLVVRDVIAAEGVPLNTRLRLLFRLAQSV